MKRGPRKTCFAGNQTGVRKHRGFESHTLRQIKKEGRKALFCAGFQETPASAGVMPQGAGFSGD